MITGICCVDMGKLVFSVDTDKVASKNVKDRIEGQKKLISGNQGGDSIISLYISADIEEGRFEKICGSHMFYTPETTGLIVSTLMDYSLVKHIEEYGWYGEFKDLCRQRYDNLGSGQVHIPGLKDKTIDVICSTPLTLERLTGKLAADSACSAGIADSD